VIFLFSGEIYFSTFDLQNHKAKKSKKCVKKFKTFVCPVKKNCYYIREPDNLHYQNGFNYIKILSLRVKNLFAWRTATVLTVLTIKNSCGTAPGERAEIDRHNLIRKSEVFRGR
jgi:hypothetical protein